MNYNRLNKKNFSDDIQTFFHSKKWKKVWIFLFFLFLSFGFWLLQYLQQKFEVDISIPLTYKNVPAEVVLNDSLPTEVRLKVKDKGTTLLNYTLNRKNDSIKIDLKKLNFQNNTYTVPRKLLETEIYKSLSSTTTLLSYNPDVLIVGYLPLKKKEIPVVLAGSLEPEIGFMFTDSVKFDPDKIIIYGSSNALDSINVIYTENLNISKIKKNLKKKVQLVTPKGVRLSRTIINLSVPVEEYTEKTFTIPVTCKNLPPDYIVRLFPSTVEVTCQISLSKYTELTDVDLEASVDYLNLVKSKVFTTTVNITRKPDWLKSFKIMPGNIEFLIEKKNLGL